MMAENIPEVIKQTQDVKVISVSVSKMQHTSKQMLERQEREDPEEKKKINVKRF